MPDHQFSTNAIRVQLDHEILKELIYGDTEGTKGDPAHDRMCALREHHVYLLLRSIVSQLNSRLKGRREKFKLVEEGDGMALEFVS